MANLATVLKTEIRRLARSEARALTAELQKGFRRERQRVAALRKLVAEQEKELRALRKAVAAAGAAPSAPEAPAGGPAPIRWRKDTIAVLRKRHDLSQAALAKLLGVGLNTVWSWEKGRSNPRSKQLHGIAELRALDKKALAERLEAVGLSSGRKKPGRKPGAAGGNTRKPAKAAKTSRKTTKKKAAKPKRKPKRTVRSKR